MMMMMMMMMMMIIIIIIIIIIITSLHNMNLPSATDKTLTLMFKRYLPSYTAYPTQATGTMSINI
jgi:hypothetical protein